MSCPQCKHCNKKEDLSTLNATVHKAVRIMKIFPELELVCCYKSHIEFKTEYYDEEFPVVFEDCTIDYILTRSTLNEVYK